MLKLNNVLKTFNKSGNIADLKLALDNITLNIENGDFVTVIGSNGSGKSTLLNVITGSHLVDEGSILIDNEEVTNLKEFKRAKHIGIVFQDPMQGTAANMSILENLLVASRRSKKKTLRWGFNKTLIEKFKEKLKDLNLGLEDRLTQKIGLLSGGQRQAITLLMATLENPKLLLLDEHTAALDPKTAQVVLKLTDRIIKEEKLTTIMVTHNMRDALRYGNRIIMLHEGKVVLDARDEEKNNLTFEGLLKKFDENNLILDDQLILNK